MATLHVDSQSAHLAQLHDTINLISPEFEQIRLQLCPASNNHESPLRITLLTKEEYHQLGKPLTPEINLEHIYVLGEGAAQEGTIRWLVVIWNHGNLWRRKMKLRTINFHIALTSKDAPNLDKSIMSLEWCSVAGLRVPQALDQAVMDHVLATPSTPMHLGLACEMVRRFPSLQRSYIRLGDTCQESYPKIAMLAYARALSLDPSLFAHTQKSLKRLNGKCAWGPTLTILDAAALEDLRLQKSLTTEWDGEVTQICNDTLWTKNAESRERITYLGQELPRFFSWLYPHRLAGMSTPRNEADVDVLRRMGVTTILTLTAEQPLSTEWFSFKPIQNIFISVENYNAPTLAEMDLIYDRFCADTDGRWLVHCGGGKGRAGTVLACIIAMLGYGPDDVTTNTPKLDSGTAIKELRSIRPGSIETSNQERFVAKWVSHRWRIAHNPDESIEEPTPLQIHCDESSLPEGLNHENVRTCFLVGMPGSGKSWVAEAIARRRAAPTIVVSQDETGSRNSCETALGRHYAMNALLIVDRCNADAKERRALLSLIHARSNAVAIFFDYSEDTCLKRIDRRLNHPTIRPGKGRNAVEHFAKVLAKPTLAEGFGAVLTINSFAASREAVLMLGGEPKLLKFPRTPHLIDLGGTTPDDIVLTTQELVGRLVVEEKIDGANMGFSLDWDRNIKVQNRSHSVSASDHPQFKALPTWIDQRQEVLQRILGQDELFPERYILYGEWVTARHSIHYTGLPDFFLAFDLFDRVNKTFVSRRILEGCLRGSKITQVPLICAAFQISRDQLIGMVQTTSRYTDGRVEGVYVRFENAEGTLTVGRGKVVRSDFITGNQHWTKGTLTWNGILGIRGSGDN